MKESVFTKIINLELPARFVFEDDFAVAFLNNNPDRAGHLLVVPKLQIDKFYEMTDEDFAKLMTATKKVAAALEKASGLRTKLEIVGIDVPHVHVHLKPLLNHGEFKESDNKLFGLTADDVQEKVVGEVAK